VSGTCLVQRPPRLDREAGQDAMDWGEGPLKEQIVLG
jgi:hypothetical protein